MRICFSKLRDFAQARFITIVRFKGNVSQSSGFRKRARLCHQPPCSPRRASNAAVVNARLGGTSGFEQVGPGERWCVNAKELRVSISLYLKQR